MWPDVERAVDVGDVARVVFFFQAEDGIRDKLVTGVQTCALPISLTAPTGPAYAGQLDRSLRDCGQPELADAVVRPIAARTASEELRWLRGEAGRGEIGRASCRERVEISVVAGSVKKKRKQRADAG